MVDAVEKKWLFGWEKINFKKKKNSDLWRRFLKIYYNHNVSFKWVKGHSNIIENDRCDQLAVEAANKTCLDRDIWYEKNERKPPSLF